MDFGGGRRVAIPLWRTVLTVTVVLAVLTVAACSSGSTAAPSGGGVVVSNAWARPSTGSAPSAAYFSVRNDSGVDDVLTGVSTSIATAEMHQTMPGASGMMAMQPVATVVIAKGATVEFKPGGYHVMLMEPTGPIEAGKTVQLTLTFQHAGSITVTADVRAQ